MGGDGSGRGRWLSTRHQYLACRSNKASPDVAPPPLSMSMSMSMLLLLLSSSSSLAFACRCRCRCRCRCCCCCCYCRCRCYCRRCRCLREVQCWYCLPPLHPTTCDLQPSTKLPPPLLPSLPLPDAQVCSRCPSDPHAQMLSCYFPPPTATARLAVPTSAHQPMTSRLIAVMQLI